jgi:hypothetical protein
MAELFQKDVQTSNEHICNVFSEGELREEGVIREFRMAASDGKQYGILHDNLDVIHLLPDRSANCTMKIW